MEDVRGCSLARTFRLRNIVGCHERQRLEADLRIAAGQGRSHDDDEIALLGEQLRQRRDAVEVGHFDVEHGDIWIDALKLVDGVEPGAQRTRDFHVGLGVDPARDQAADNNRIIHHHDADRLLPRRGGGRGTRQRNTHTSPITAHGTNETITPKAAEPPDREWLQQDDFSSSRHPALSFFLEHDLCGKPVSTFPDHALLQINPTSWNFAVTISLSKGFMMYSLAPACSARAIWATSFSVVQNTTLGWSPPGMRRRLPRNS